MSAEDKVAIVTGGNRGIGKGIALGLAQDGADIAVNYRKNEEEAGETVVRVGEIRKGESGCTVRGSQGTWGAREDWEATHLG